jgi:hypothetical protein
MQRKHVVISILVLMGCLAGLLAWDTVRRARLSVNSKTLETQGTRIDAPSSLEDPIQFAEFCKRLRTHYMAMDERYRSCSHRRQQRTRERDSKGHFITEEEIIEKVWFENGEERRTTISHTNMKTGKPMKSGGIQQILDVGRKPYVYPFTKDDHPGDFEYAFEGLEKIDSLVLARIRFAPKPPFGRKTAGIIWADVKTAMPWKFVGRWHRPTAPVDRFEMTYEYGLAENGHIQVRRMISDGAGGFAFFTKNYHVVVDFDLYSPKAVGRQP